ncbi:hypothetical protein BGZ50_007022 [Haplosporangium sp. Z 11]|nr:hypothetical protein BGZ50_007022 [Haplosporangium sp. Z 11]
MDRSKVYGVDINLDAVEITRKDFAAEQPSQGLKTEMTLKVTLPSQVQVYGTLYLEDEMEGSTTS